MLSASSSSSAIFRYACSERGGAARARRALMRLRGALFVMRESLMAGECFRRRQLFTRLPMNVALRSFAPSAATISRRLMPTRRG